MTISQANSRNVQDALPLPAVVLSPEDYAYVVRTTNGGEQETQLQVQVGAQLYPNSRFRNVIATFPGTDPTLPPIMIGAHLDSVGYGEGADDNASGVSSVLEAVRILTTLRARHARTIMIGLWDGEELGLLGSVAYLRTKPVIGLYLNADEGGGKIRGLFTNGNASLERSVGTWLAPLAGVGASNIARRYPFEGSSSDFRAFQENGIPGMDFIQDPEDYEVRIHSNLDRFSYLDENKLRHNAAVIAWTLLQAANN